MAAVGTFMIAAAVVAVPSAAVQMAALLIGAGLLILGALMSRLTGTVKLTTSSLEFQVLECLQATREEAQRRAPERVDEAVGRAFARLATEDGTLDSDAHPPTRAKRRLRPVTGVALGASLIVLLMAGLGAVAEKLQAQQSELAQARAELTARERTIASFEQRTTGTVLPATGAKPPTTTSVPSTTATSERPESGATPSSTADSPGVPVMVLIVVLLVIVVGALAVRRRAIRSRRSLSIETPSAAAVRTATGQEVIELRAADFARDVVDELAPDPAAAIP